MYSKDSPYNDLPPLTDSPSSNSPSKPLNAPKNTDIPVSLNNDNPENTPVSTQTSEEMKPEESPPSASLPEETPPVSAEPAQTSQKN